MIHYSRQMVCLLALITWVYSFSIWELSKFQGLENTLTQVGTAMDATIVLNKITMFLCLLTKTRQILLNYPILNRWTD
jgi:hypothetical protein